MKRTFSFHLLLALSIMALLCSFSNDDDAGLSGPQISLLLAKSGATDTFDLFTNGRIIPLENIGEHYTTSLASDNNSLYTAGYYRNAAEWNGVNWVDGDALTFPSTTIRTYTTDNTVSACIHFITGRKVLPGTGISAYVWKNREILDLPLIEDYNYLIDVNIRH
ncbi:hypothetical protein [Nonlabens xiamenensis]|uniref:hypothetical protein n=1 Tax=Nonlabens xiamenensis TaxID=2341043 RepID=UPI000F611E82|nr:hypothetical protein [Nonlabens xiamenensis]